MIAVGSRIYGFAGGYFGRDSYDDKTVEAVGADWVVARELDGDKFMPVFASSPLIHVLLEPFLTQEEET